MTGNIHSRCCRLFPKLFGISLLDQFSVGVPRSKIAETLHFESPVAARLTALEAMKSDKGLEQEIEFETKLRALLGEYNKSLGDVIAILDPQAGSKAGRTPQASEKRTRKARAVRIYKNPHTGEMVETKGGNHKMLKEWKAEYGSETVESWLS